MSVSRLASSYLTGISLLSGVMVLALLFFGSWEYQPTSQERQAEQIISDMETQATAKKQIAFV